MIKYLFFFAVLIVSCAKDNSILDTETVERYDVKYKQDSLVIDKLNYKDTQFFDANDRLQKKVIFDKTGKVKGTESLYYTNQNAKSEYRSADSTLLSIYEYSFENGFLLEKRAYDASNNSLLRIEQYSYDSNGNQTEKIIMDSNEIINRVYKFAFDEYGNELGFSVFDNQGKIILLETYEITDLDDDNRWIKKWAVRDSVIRAYYERTFQKNNNK